ncbi:MAG: hypothetical protein HWQ40_16455 [Nostoc sp. NMS9]|nr:hypothetical protein [Nostoc sp. NMS9]
MNLSTTGSSLPPDKLSYLLVSPVGGVSFCPVELALASLRNLAEKLHVASVCHTLRERRERHPFAQRLR